MQTIVDRINNALDAALEMTFPASDPIAVYIAESEPKPKICAIKRRNPGALIAASTPNVPRPR
jgi:hypothetical protein